MTTAAVTTAGLLLKRGQGDGPPETFTLIPEVTDIAGPDESSSQVDATSFDSTAKEYVAGLSDAGEVTFTMNFVGSSVQQQGLRTDHRAGTLRNFKLILKDDTVEGNRTTISFAALVTNLSGPQGAVDGVITQSCTLKVSGQPTVAYNS